MRVITGLAKGRRLKTLKGMDIRPTSDRVKESIFTILHFEIQGRKVLDLFAGSGQLGIEALSRGAKFAVFVDKDPAAIGIIRQNLKHTGLSEQSHVIKSDAESFLSNNTDSYDIVLLDPPYNFGSPERILKLLSSKVNTGGIVVCEHSSEEAMPKEAGDLAVYRSYKYGNVSVTTYRSKE